jgi:hypothetical protein
MESYNPKPEMDYSTSKANSSDAPLPAPSTMHPIACPHATRSPLALPWLYAHSHHHSCLYILHHCHAVMVTTMAAITGTPPGNPSSLRDHNGVLPEVPGVQKGAMASWEMVRGVSGIAARGRKGKLAPPEQQEPLTTL